MPKFENLDPYSPKRRWYKTEMSPNETTRMETLNVKLRMIRLPDAPQFIIKFVPSAGGKKKANDAFWGIYVVPTPRTWMMYTAMHSAYPTLCGAERWVEEELPLLYDDPPPWWLEYSDR